MDSYLGKKLNAPNDVVVHSNGSIWFTDPGYGILSSYEGHVDKFELPTNIYRLDPSSDEVTVVAGDFARPNGLCFSPDEKLLYIVDSGQPDDKPHPIRVFNVVNGKTLENGRLFCDMGRGTSDGIRCDMDGNIWSAAGWAGKDYDGVHVFAPDGKLIGRISLPEPCANICFGGEKRNRLFMTASQSLYSLYVNAKGAMMP
jgi:gluconolactonase